MKDYEIQALAQRFGLMHMLHSKRQVIQFYAFVREIERTTKESTLQEIISCDDNPLKQNIPVRGLNTERITK